jgi:hypothetical protein
MRHSPQGREYREQQPILRHRRNLQKKNSQVDRTTESKQLRGNENDTACPIGTVRKTDMTCRVFGRFTKLAIKPAARAPATSSRATASTSKKTECSKFPSTHDRWDSHVDAGVNILPIIHGPSKIHGETPQAILVAHTLIGIAVAVAADGVPEKRRVLHCHSRAGYTKVNVQRRYGEEHSTTSNTTWTTDQSRTVKL